MAWWGNAGDSWLHYGSVSEEGVKPESSLVPQPSHCKPQTGTSPKFMEIHSKSKVHNFHSFSFTMSPCHNKYHNQKFGSFVFHDLRISQPTTRSRTIWPWPSSALAASARCASTATASCSTAPSAAHLRRGRPLNCRGGVARSATSPCQQLLGRNCLRKTWQNDAKLYGKKIKVRVFHRN